MYDTVTLTKIRTKQKGNILLISTSPFRSKYRIYSNKRRPVSYSLKEAMSSNKRLLLINATLQNDALTRNLAIVIPYLN